MTAGTLGLDAEPRLYSLDKCRRLARTVEGPFEIVANASAARERVGAALDILEAQAQLDPRGIQLGLELIKRHNKAAERRLDIAEAGVREMMRWA